MGSCLPCAATSLLLLQLAVLASLSAAGHRRYHSIFNFGDSFADTGNKPVAYAWYSLPSNVMRPPYGETFFGHPTGRSSDGRLILDLIAAGLGLPFVPPYLAHGGSFGGGANFAVAGATALDAGFFHDRDIPGAGSKFPLNTSLDRLMKHGAKSIVVPGMIPSGCSPPALTSFYGRAGPADYDARTGCLREINELASHHNSLLQDALHELRSKHPDAAIVYADFFRPVMEMVESPRRFGFREDVLTVCCGGGGPYNFNESVACGGAAATACEDPSASLYFDGAHLTEAGYRHVADGWLSSINSCLCAHPHTMKLRRA
uniref:Esterase n=1 Tax=Oryza meridionalis TaxID=40149 RepID=A0A0E0BZ75_9ORYZ